MLDVSLQLELEADDSNQAAVLIVMQVVILVNSLGFSGEGSLLK